MAACVSHVCVWSLIGPDLDLLNLFIKARWLTAGWVSVSYIILIAFILPSATEQIPHDHLFKRLKSLFHL